MDEQEFDTLFRLRPFGSEEAKRADARYRRGLSLSVVIWGETADDLRRQLLLPSPEIPTGFDLADFRELLRTTEELTAAMRRHRIESPTIFVGGRRYTEWEARYEIIRRAIEFLENR